MNPKISVIIPTYNRKFCIERAVLSVIQQTRKCDELIIVDDGSTDGTKNVVDRIAHHCSTEIKYIAQPNSGPAAARNTGIRLAKSELIAFLDSDDHWQKTKLARQCAVMENNPQYLVSHTKERWMRAGKHLNQKKIHIPRSGNIFDHCLLLCAVGMSTAMVRKELFDKVGLFNESFHCCEDYEFWLRVSLNYSFLLVDEPLTVKEGGRDDQLSNQYRVGMDKLRITAIINILENHQLTPENKKLATAELQKKCLIYGNGCLKHGKEKEAQEYLDLAKKYGDQM